MIQRYYVPEGCEGKCDTGWFVRYTDHLALPAEKDEAEQNTRLFLALNHGHKGIYLDDGEIQCGECRPNWDYKKPSLLTVAKVAVGVLLEQIAALTAERLSAQTSNADKAIIIMQLRVTNAKQAEEIGRLREAMDALQGNPTAAGKKEKKP
jgi:hypothetical protein